MTTLFATGNNLIVASDLTRRTLRCALDAECEQPELRTFNDNILDTIRRDRGHLVGCALTILRAWHLANPSISCTPFGSFEDWSTRIREPLLWLGQKDPCESIQTVRESDPERGHSLSCWNSGTGCLEQPQFIQCSRSSTLL